MPHATEDETMGGFDEAAEIQRFLGNGMGAGGEEDDREIDQGDKADDAIDYEDISDDDDLPEEEEATHIFDNTFADNVERELYDQMTGGLDGLPGQPDRRVPVEHGHAGGDLFGDADETNDLFGDRMSSPEEERRPSRAPQAGGLALPSKSSLALPTCTNGYQQTRPVPQGESSSASSPPYQDQEYSALSPNSMTEEEDEDSLDPQLMLQRRLFKASALRNTGDDSVHDPTETDMGTFYQLYPDWEKDSAPKFVQLFPPRNVEYKGKTPLKPPKVVQPTKLTLDLLQDQERAFKALAAGNRSAQESTFNNSFVLLQSGHGEDNESDLDFAESDFDENEMLGNVSIHDLALICHDWDIPSTASDDEDDLADRANGHMLDNGDWEMQEHSRPAKKRKTGPLSWDVDATIPSQGPSFQDPERATARLARSVALDLNDPHLLIDEHASGTKAGVKRLPGDKRDSALNRDIAKRYNISNDPAYDLLKENHQHKVRSTLGSMAVEHSFPAVKLQFPFYRMALDPKAKRAFHRPHLDLRAPAGREYRFTKPKHVKKKHVRGKEAKEVFAKAEDLTLGDSASMLLLEYSEEAPMMLSNFGMGNRLINYYRKQHTDDQNRGDKREVGEQQVLLTQDKSPFANFGHVDKGETVPTIQNGLYRAPVFAHQAKQTDFVVGVSSTHEHGDKLFLRNVENLHTVGQQFPLSEVPGQHSRKVTDAAKKRLRALAYRIYIKSQTRKDKVLDNASLMPHLPGHDMPQTRSKMREFMKYERVTSRSDGSTGVWVPPPGSHVPTAEELRNWIRPEDVCLLDSMQVGVQHLSDLGINESKDADEDKDIDEGANIELQLAPWRATKNFLNACQGKAMLKLHGDGDPTGHGLGFSFVKTSMKGGFQAQGESVEDKIDKQRRKDTGGHSYNVAKQQKQYEDSIRRIWESQRTSLQDNNEFSDDDMDEPDRSAEYNNQAYTPRSSFSTPAAFASKADDDLTSQYSGHSTGRGDKTFVITRSGGYDQFGQPLPDVKETITNPAIIREYRKRVLQREYANAEITNFVPTGDPEKDDFARQQLQKELERIKRNAERREAREKLKAKHAAQDVSAAGSPGQSDIDGPASTVNGPAGGGGGTDATTPQKGKGRSKDGTQRKCANCGQVGHIKTNRKSVTTFQCPFCFARNPIPEKQLPKSAKKNKKDASPHGRNKKSVNGGETSSFSDLLPTFKL